MYTVTINVKPHLAEYARSKYGDEAGVVKFPPTSDIGVLIVDLLEKRPPTAGADKGNLTFAIFDTREARCARGKAPGTYNYISARSAAVIGRKIEISLWADFHDFVDEARHMRGETLCGAVYAFRVSHGIESLSEDAMIKNYQRWRAKSRSRRRRR